MDNLEKIIENLSPRLEDPDHVYLVRRNFRKDDEGVDRNEVVEVHRMGSADELERKYPALRDVCDETGTRLYIDFALKSRKLLDAADPSAAVDYNDSERFNVPDIKHPMLIDVDTNDKAYLSMVLDSLRHAGQDVDFFVVPTPKGHHVVVKTLFLFNIFDRAMKLRVQTFKHSILPWPPQVLLYKNDR